LKTFITSEKLSKISDPSALNKRLSDQPLGRYHYLWRNLAWLGVKAPYANVPHLRGDLLTGRFSYLHKENGILETIIEANKLAENSTSGMCSFWVKNKLMLLIQKPAYIYDFKCYHEKYVNRAVAYWNFFPGPSVIASQENLSLDLRNAYKHAVFDTKALNEIEPKIDAICNDYILGLKKEKNYLIDAEYCFRKLAVELAAKLFMGLNEENSINSHNIVHYLSKLLSGPSSTLNLLGFQDDPIDNFLFPQNSLERLKQFKKEMETELKSLLNDYTEVIKSNDNLFHALWKLGKQLNDDVDLTIENLFPDAFFFLVGGIVLTLGDSFSTVIKLIVTHPDVERKLYQELERQEKGGLINPRTLDKLEYLDMIIKEAFRLCPLIPIIPVRTVKTPFTFQGITLDKGDGILVSPYASHHSSIIWEDPEKFIPERFSKEKEVTIPQGAYIPFGLGSRSCIGKWYAMKVLKIFIPKLFHEFCIGIENSHKQSNLDGPALINKNMMIQLTPRDKLEELNPIRTKSFSS
jgi:cytochrome P450